jgi:hypothetical protein
MSQALTVTPVSTKHGTVFKVYFFHKRRIRFTIDDVASYQDAVAKATEIRDGVVAGRLAFKAKNERQYARDEIGGFLATYKKEIQAEQLQDPGRPLKILETIILPRWGHLKFGELTRGLGLDLILRLRAEKFAEQGIRRIINVARRYVGLAIRHGRVSLSANPLADLPLQPYQARDRVATPDELNTLLRLASPRMRDAITLAMNLPLRQELILQASREYVYRRNDGLWYRPPKAPTTIKGRPLELPLNPTAAAIFDKAAPDQPLLFPDWKADKFRKSWRRLCKRAQIPPKDLHFHDLRRNAGSAMQEGAGLGKHKIHPAVINLVLGHTTKDVTDIYKSFDSWRPALREAMTVLDRAWRQVLRARPKGPTAKSKSRRRKQ